MNENAVTLVRMLSEKGIMLATAESCTGGLIAKLVTDVPGSSEVFHMGAVTYSNDIKAKLLGVREATLDRFGAVSEQTALEMAEGVRRAAGAGLGVSSTGISGPGGDGSGCEPGISFIAVSNGENAVCRKLETHRNDRDFNRGFTADAALRLVCEFIDNTEGGK